MYSILIIEDEPSFREMMKLILQMEGYEVSTAADGRAGLAMVGDKHPDLILCDIMMPGMDGHAVLEALRSYHGYADIPFIFVSALGEREQVRSGMSAGADDYLPKPFSAEELLAAIAARISRHKTIKMGQLKTAFREEQSILRKTITRREREVLIMVGRGATSKDIASCLGICEKTAEVHRANIMRKLGACNAASLARWAFLAEQAEIDSE